MEIKIKKFFYIKYLLAFLAVSIFFLINIRFMQRFLDFDQTVYIRNIKSWISYPEYRIFNPHHLHFEISGKYFSMFVMKHFEKYGLSDLTFILRLRSLLFSCIGLFSLIILLIKITGKHALGLLGGILTAVCHGYFHYSTKVDTAIFPASWLFVILLCVYELYNAEKNIIILSCITGILMIIAVLFHQYMTFVFAAAILTLFIPSFMVNSNFSSFGFINIYKDKTKKAAVNSTNHRLISMLIITGITATTVFLIYFFIGAGIYKLPFDKPDPKKASGIYKNSTFQEWLFAYEANNSWGAGLRNFDPKKPARGLSDAFLSQNKILPKYSHTNFDINCNLSSFFDSASFINNNLALFMILTITGLLFLFPAMIREYGRFFYLLIISLIILTVFFTYWEPFYFEFWIMPCGIIIIIGILLINLLINKLDRIFKNSGRLLYIYLSFLIIIFFTHNYRYNYLPFSGSSIYEGMQMWIESDRNEFFLELFSDGIYKKK